jgi:hypothetical protein
MDRAEHPLVLQAMAVPNPCPEPPACLLLLPQITVNNDITDVWMFWDTHKMFSEWAGVLSKLYMRSAALVTGWVSMIFLAGRFYSRQLLANGWLPCTIVAD